MRLTTKQAATYLGVHYNTLEHYRTAGQGPRFIKLSAGRRGGIRYDTADLDRWLEQRKQSSTSDKPELRRRRRRSRFGDPVNVRG